MASTSDTVGGEATTAAASPAARCIELRLLGHTFRPVYTHQLFENEIIHGYVPPDIDDVIESDEPTTRKLAIHINLAPSCEQCQVSLQTTRPKKRRLLRSHDAQKSTKQARTDSIVDGNNESNEENNNHSNEDSDKVTSERSVTESSESSVYVDDDDEEEKDETSEMAVEEGNTRHRRMPLSEVEQHLSKALPRIVATTESAQVRECYLKGTPGSHLEEYERNGDQFCLTLANGSDAVAYHNEVQRLARFFVETADDVDVANQSDGGNWNVLYLFQKHDTEQYSLAGYFTLFHFNSPFRKPSPGIVMRICQAFILPPYQRSGHGNMMLSAVYKWAFDGYRNQLQGDEATLPKSIVEINVEDPAPAFVALRNRVDYQRFLAAKTDDEEWFGSAVDSSKNADVTESDFFAPLPDSILNEASAHAKVTSKQIQVVYELLRLHQLQVHCDTTDTAKQDTLEKRYRLLVKKRLQREYKEDLGACKNKEEMKAFLTQLYEEVRQQYESITRTQQLS